MDQLERQTKRLPERMGHAAFGAATAPARAPQPAPAAIVLRFDDLPATPCNRERMSERVRTLNLRLADSGTPFRLRVI